MKRKNTLLMLSLFLLAVPAESTDFTKYTTISQSLKNALRSNWSTNFQKSGYTSGNVATFGNSITNTRAFWVPFSYSAPGVVPGTNLDSYLTDKDNGVNCATSGYTIDDGMDCLVGAMNSLKPEVVVCEYGTNDVSDGEIGTFGNVYRRYLDSVLVRGIIPIISTVPPRGGARELVTRNINDTIRKIASEKKVVLVDFYNAFMDHTNNNPFTNQWMDEARVHPSGGDALTEMTNPVCGYAIRNAVTWYAVNKVYRIIVDNGPADSGAVIDTIPPSTITNLTATSGKFSGTVSLSWTAPGGDGSIGTVSSYDIRYSLQTITAINFNAATRFNYTIRPQTSGSDEKVVVSGLIPGSIYYFAVISFDGSNNSVISNVVSATAPVNSAGIKDSLLLTATEDTYLENGADKASVWGKNNFIRIKSGGQGIPLFKFNLSSLPFSPDSAVIQLHVDSDISGASDYSYTVDICGVTTLWNETAASYNIASGTSGWPQNDPHQSFDNESKTTSSFTGTKNSQPKHEFPVAAAVISKLIKGSYSSIGIWETGSAYNNCHFSSREGSNPPVLKLYSFTTSKITMRDVNNRITTAKKLAEHYKNSEFISVYNINGKIIYKGKTPMRADFNHLLKNHSSTILFITFSNASGEYFSGYYFPK